MYYRRHTHIAPTIMLFAAAMLPAAPLATNSAYRDTELSSGNLLRAASTWGEEQKLELSEPQLAPSLFSVELGEPVVEESTEETPTTTEEVLSEEQPQEEETLQDENAQEEAPAEDADTPSVEEEEAAGSEEPPAEDVQEEEPPQEEAPAESPAPKEDQQES